MMKKHTLLLACVAMVLMSFVFAPPNPSLLGSINGAVLLQLFLLMLCVRYLVGSGVIRKVTVIFTAGEKDVQRLSVRLLIVTAILSMFVTNDIALITIVPLSLFLFKNVEDAIVRRVIILETLAANLGSMLTPFGNPQNLFLYDRYELSLSFFLRTMLPLTLLAIVGIVVLGYCILPKLPFSNSEYGEGILLRAFDPVISTGCFLLAVAAVLRALPFNFVCVLICFLIFIRMRRAFYEVDYELLLIFVCFFLLSAQLQRWPLLFDGLRYWMEVVPLGVAVLISQVISNVPAAVLLSGFTENATALLLGTNIGGLGTLVASLASLISYRYYVKRPGANELEYLLEFTSWNMMFLAILLAVVFLMQVII